MRFKHFKFLAFAGAIAALSAQSNQAEAIFASVKSTGMAATAISYPLDSLCGAYNPAGEAYIDDRVDVEGGWVHDWGSNTTKGNIVLDPVTHQPIINPETGKPEENPFTNGHFEGMRSKDVFPGNLGINKVWCLGCDWELATSLIIYNRNYQKTTYNKPLYLLGTSNAGLEYVNETVSPIVALKWCDSHTLGISVNYQIERVKVNGIQNFDHLPTLTNPTGTIAPGHVTNRGYDYATGWGVTIGYLGRITDCLNIGLTYQPKTKMSRMNKYKGFLAQKGRLDVPEKIGGGISYKFLNCLVVAFDVEYIRWSPVRSLSNPLIAKVTTIPGVPNLLGEDDGPGFGFKNQTYYRVGAEWTINESWVARIGFRHANSPVRPSQTAVNALSLDTVEDFITVGGTWNINQCNELSFFYAYGFENVINGKNSIPAAFGGGEINLKEQKYALGVAWGWKF